ncbi:macrophage mannose receptor 1-like [Scomber scombrus]|uniref:Macrophage mannose receptor 1-like n=1 Tax=Scomber scombrus TaxID=13677 RepID=A0AAV1P2H5_SCOSC
MERFLLVVLYLSGWFIFSTSGLHQYHYVAEQMTWTEAQTYCREKYTDLATIETMGDMNQLVNTVSSAGYNSLVWIGLYSNIGWRWSDGYRGSGAEFRNWQTEGNEPNFRSGDQFCVCMEQRGVWLDYWCSIESHFICNNGTQLDPQFVYISQSMNWSSAQRYCRENYIDLATVRNDTENQQIQKMIGTWAWIGLFRNPDTYWSDGSNSSFTYWDSGSHPLGSLSRFCAAAVQKSGKWKAKSCEDRLPFVCYSIPGSSGLHQYHYVAEQMTWTEAQTYCREKYTDLATIETMEDMNQLVNTVSSAGNNSLVWIGLYSNIDWRWSDEYRGSGAAFRNWYTGANNEPDFTSGVDFCVVTGIKGEWWDDGCSLKYPTICNNGTQLDPQFVHISQSMNWSSAQRYCRENYIDLATVRDDTENQQIQKMIGTWTWIGLFRNPDSYWSDGSNSSFTYWDGGSHPLGSLSRFCAAAVQKSGKWKAKSCEDRLPFVCYSIPGTQLDPQFVYISQSMSWSSAQRYCRENYIDLATVRNDTENQQIQKMIGGYAWIGLFRNPDTYWSDGSGSSFTYWDGGSHPLGSLSRFCGAAVQKSGKWKAKSCEDRLPFVCYSITVKRQVVKLRMKLEDSSVDLNDPAVKAQILKKFQDRLKEQGVSGATLKWREQPDGKVFHEEGKEEKKKSRKKTEL